MLNRRSILALAAVPAIPAAAQQYDPPVSLAWQRASVTANDGTVQTGVLVNLSAPSADVRAFELRVRWRRRFLTDGPTQEYSVLVARQPDGRGVCFVVTGGGESWLQVEAWGLQRREYAVSSI